ncbi:MAG: glycoside hydrolase family 5 protein [Thermoguttaceae bacterium]|nr:glycoside hydrolase family 5 protein [Thermoguttaceae bacterium]MDW8078014.1 cellulase family glycosylhydrolase [Thermoguttaceae bacterium]
MSPSRKAWSLAYVVVMVASSYVYGGEPVFRLTFDEIGLSADGKPIWPATWQMWPGAGFRPEESPAGGKCLRVDILPGDKEHGRYLRIPLDASLIAGKRLRVSARIRAEDVSAPPNPWNGVKCMLQLVGETDTRWPQKNLPGGTFPWQGVVYVCEVPPDCRTAFLVLGLEQVTGRAWFDDILIEIIGSRRKTPPVAQAGPPFKGHALPRLRGAMIGPRVRNEDILEFGKVWGANHIRWQLIWDGFPHSPADRASVDEYRRWLEGALQRLDAALPACREAGILVAVDLHTPPGGRNESAECRVFHDKQFQQAFLKIWEEIAARYRNEPAVWGYDLMNEPVEGVVPDGLMNWQQLAEETARRIRAIDPEHAIIVEPPAWANPDALDWFEPVPVPGVVYSVHMYIPHRFTHQGVHGNPTGVHYPGEVDGRHYDRQVLEAVLEPAVRFQRDYNVHIYIGEFSAIRWAPGDSAYRYLKDCIEIFEKHGWDWAYHAFREWHGWSVEHGPDPNQTTPVPFLTDRAQLLRSWFAKNEKPRF